MPVHGVTLHWAAHITPDGEQIPDETYYFIGVPDEGYIEVKEFPTGPEGVEESLRRHLAGEDHPNGSRTIPMRFAKRWFNQQETLPEVTCQYHDPLWPDESEPERVAKKKTN